MAWYVHLTEKSLLEQNAMMPHELVNNQKMIFIRDICVDRPLTVLKTI